MKKKFFWLLFLSSFFAVQGKAQRGLEIGFDVLGQGSMLLDTAISNAGDEMNQGILLSYAAGGHVGINFTRFMGVGVGFLMSKQGTALSNKEGYVVDSVAIPQRFYGVRLEYHKFPVYLKFNSSLQNNASAQVMFGPQLSFLKRARAYDKGAIVNGDTIVQAYTTELPVDATSIFKETDLGVMFAFNGRYNLSKYVHISSLFRVDYSLSSIYRNTNASDARNLTFGLQLGLNFVIGVKN